jgi:predicted ATPase
MSVLLRSIALHASAAQDIAAADSAVANRSFPFNVPAIRELGLLEFPAPVTFFVGENGSGKSTLLEALAIVADLPTVGSTAVHSDRTLDPQRELARLIRATWTRRVRRGFFLRAEDFFGFARRMAQLRTEMVHRVAEVNEQFADATEHTRGLAAGPARASLADMERLYGNGVDERSHGESFLNLFRSRLVPQGLYLLDEPEAALSPQSQLALLAMIADAVADGSQFVIASHSPILMALPGATIYSFDSLPVERIEYDDVEHVTLTRAFLQDPAAFTRRLLG